MSPKHKLISIFDSHLTAFIQLLIPEILCFDDPLIARCSPIYLMKDIECDKNAVWNIVDKMCFCKGGFFLDLNTRTCERCKCTEVGQFCLNSATDCSDSTYFEINMDKSDDVAGRACWINTYGIDFYNEGFI